MHAAVWEYGSVAIRGDIKDLANETSATRHVIRPGGWPLPHSHTGAMYTQNDPSIISISCVTSTHTHTHTPRVPAAAAAAAIAMDGDASFHAVADQGGSLQRWSSAGYTSINDEGVLKTQNF